MTSARWKPQFVPMPVVMQLEKINPPMTEAVRVTRLANGLTVVSENMPRVETVSFGAYVSVGTRHETPLSSGVSCRVPTET